MNDKILQAFTDNAIEIAIDRYKNNEIEMCEIPQVAHGIIDGKTKDKKHTLNTYCYWLDDGSDRLQNIIDDMILYCTTHKVIAHAIHKDNFDDGFIFISFIQENKGANNVSK